METNDRTQLTQAGRDGGWELEDLADAHLWMTWRRDGRIIDVDFSSRGRINSLRIDHRYVEKNKRNIAMQALSSPPAVSH